LRSGSFGAVELFAALLRQHGLHVAITAREP
jgi:hypothetical protein